MSYFLGLLKRFENSLPTYLGRTASIIRVEQCIALLDRLKAACEAAIPRIRARLEREQGARLQNQAMAREQLISEWIKKTEKSARVLKIAELKATTEDVCSICLENHTNEEMISCGCTHRFGKKCFLMFVESNYSNPVLCPYCRTTVKSFHGFRQRAARKPRNPVNA
jgi:hypothetical protein